MRASLKLIKQSIERTKREVTDPIGVWSSHSWSNARSAFVIRNRLISYSDISEEATTRLTTLKKLYCEALKHGNE